MCYSCLCVVSVVLLFCYALMWFVSVRVVLACLFFVVCLCDRWLVCRCLICFISCCVGFVWFVLFCFVWFVYLCVLVCFWFDLSWIVLFRLEL